MLALTDHQGTMALHSFSPATGLSSSLDRGMPPTTNDFGQPLRKLRFTGYARDKKYLGTLIKNVIEVALNEGFKLNLTNLPCYIRDYLFHLPDGKIKMSSSSVNVKEALERGSSKNFYFSEVGSTRTRQLSFMGDCGKSLNRQSEIKKDYIECCGITPGEFPFFLEGGNVYILTNNQGVRKILIGKNSLAHIHAQLRLDGAFKDLPEQEDLTDEQVIAGAEEMYAMKLLSLGPEKRTGFIPLDNMGEVYKARMDVSSYREEAILKGHCHKFEMSKAVDIAKVKPLVAKFLAQKAAIPELLKKHFQGEVHFIPSVDYHLDTFMMPGPAGSIFLQDFEACKQMLMAIRQERELTFEDRCRIDNYLTAAKVLENDLGGLLAAARTELEQAGFTVIPTPGNFLDFQTYAMRDTPVPHIRFLNAISGRNERHPYLITLGAKVGDHLGTYLMQAFEKFLKGYQSDLVVHFVGYNPENSQDFSIAMAWAYAHAGIRCMSFEEEVSGSL